MQTLRPMWCFANPHGFVYILYHESWLSKMRHLGVAHSSGAMNPNSNLAKIFVRCIYPPSFIILCSLVWKLLCWHINKHTNKQIPAKTSNVLRYATTLNMTKKKSHCPPVHPQARSLRSSVQALASADTFAFCEYTRSCMQWLLKAMISPHYRMQCRWQSTWHPLFDRHRLFLSVFGIMLWPIFRSKYWFI